MRIRELKASGWRNLAPLELTFDPAVRLNVLSGDNGQGKTNVLEALYYLAVFRSFRTSRTSDLVQQRSSGARIAAQAESRDLLRSVEVQLTLRAQDEGPGTGALPGHSPPIAAASAMEKTRAVVRGVRLDGKPIRGLSAAYGALSVVLFVPEDLMLVRAAPAARRRFIDMAISAVEPAYFAEAATFQKLLRSRNALLRGGGRASVGGSPLLDTYDEQLAGAGARLVMRRRHLVESLGPGVEGIFQALHGSLPVRLTYVGDAVVMAATGEAEVRVALSAGLARRRAIDERRGHTTFGPHTDDLEIQLGERPAREHASQGQLRSLVLAMKLAELAHVERVRGEAPVLLLDDVPSELDPTRRHYLFETLAALSCQTVVTVADPHLLPSVSARADFTVRGGRVVAVPVFPLQSSA